MAYCDLSFDYHSLFDMQSHNHIQIDCHRHSHLICRTLTDKSIWIDREEKISNKNRNCNSTKRKLSICWIWHTSTYFTTYYCYCSCLKESIQMYGLIMYANENILNWPTTLADSFRVSNNMAQQRLQFKLFHDPLFSYEGIYVVTQL